MEVLVIQRFNDFQIASSSLAGIQSVSIAYNFCKWSAVILALVAAFGGIVNRIKILILRLLHETHSLASSNLLSNLDLDDYSSSSDGEDGNYSSPSTVSSECEEDEDEQAVCSVSFQWRRVDEDFLVRGSGYQLDDRLQSGKVRHRRRRSIGEIFSLSEIANSKSVVKLWDSIGFGLGLDFDDYESSCSAAAVAGALAAGEKASIPAQSSLSPAVVVTAGESASRNLAVAIWDMRLRCRTPAVIAEWEANEGRIVGVGSGGVEKVYVKDDVRCGVTVGDMRKVTSPLGMVTESDLDTWWDEDAVIVSGESDESVLRRP
ncbi:uncharacterized protein LOC129323036 [Prosopis cineraria]|uniref:uncharacterized protein LOC129323036 n=1 Tax=Prosopis cineraria TaxID=364024 RepID=UPI00241059CC|nr:uncharacterized protein LOC129323036 [Prosopis cineraria]